MVGKIFSYSKKMGDFCRFWFASLQNVMYLGVFRCYRSFAV